ncbi:MAG: 16S rRNA (cytosine(1402)-N(4))-methyltransferase RsmH [Thiotrichaceae bacterium]
MDDESAKSVFKSEIKNETFQHETVMLHEAVAALNIKKDGCYVDATYGRGGHSAEILKQLGPTGRLIVIDKDPQAIAHAKDGQAKDNRIVVWQGAFSHFPEALNEAVASGEVGSEVDSEVEGEVNSKRIDGLLLDLGVSSPQLDDASRGFSFMRDGALDMRMNPDVGLSASEWLHNAEEAEIADVIWRYGEERFSRRIARVIVERREEEKIVTTKQLADLIAGTIYRKEPGKHPATRSFQAIRIFINRELDDLTDCLDLSLKHLAPQGRLVVISFHSLEDRIVKRFLQVQQRGPKIPKGLPIMADQYAPQMRMIGKAHKPSKTEVSNNVRSRSAIMRIGERTDVKF